jgi:hypothetical protein
MPHEIAMEGGDYFLLWLRPAENLAGTRFARFLQTPAISPDKAANRGVDHKKSGNPKTQRIQHLDTRISKPAHTKSIEGANSFLLSSTYAELD